MSRFDDRVVVITGAGTGIGLATAQLFASEGANVTMSGRSRERGEREAASIRADGGRAQFVQTDVGDDAQVAELARIAANDTGRIDLWFSNAGTEGPHGLPDEWRDEEVAEVLATNLKGVLSGLKHASAKMPSGGVIVNNASFVGPLVAVPVSIPYCASKAGVVAATRAAALAFEDRAIKVLSICPWIFDTPMVDRLTDGAGFEARTSFAKAWTPSGRLGRPEEVAQVIADLFDGTLDSTSGDALLVDAGPTITPLPAP